MSQKSLVAIVAIVVLVTGCAAIPLFKSLSGSLEVGMVIGVPLILLALMVLLRFCWPERATHPHSTHHEGLPPAHRHDQLDHPAGE